MDDHRRSTEIVHWPISSLDGGAAVDRNKYRARLRSMSKTMDNPVDATRSAVEHASDNRFHRVTPTSTRRHSIITETGRFWNRAASIRAAKISVQHISSRVLYEQLGQLWRVPTSNYNCAIIGRGGRGGRGESTYVGWWENFQGNGRFWRLLWVLGCEYFRWWRRALMIRRLTNHFSRCWRI